MEIQHGGHVYLELSTVEALLKIALGGDSSGRANQGNENQKEMPGTPRVQPQINSMDHLM